MILKLLLISFVLLLPIASAMDSYNVRYNITDVNATPVPTPTPQIIIISSGGGGSGGSVISQNPPSVSVRLIDTISPSIVIGIEIKNEGITPYEYVYTWTLYKYIDNNLSKINSGQSSVYLLPKNLTTVPLKFILTEGKYELKTDVKWSYYTSSAATEFVVESQLESIKNVTTTIIDQNIISVLLGMVLLILFSYFLFYKTQRHH